MYDGQFSNRCYQQAVRQAFHNFSQRAIKLKRWDPELDTQFTVQWSRIIMHLPYAFQAKRMFPDVFRHDRMNTPMWPGIIEQIGEQPAKPESDDPEAIMAWEKEMDGYRRAISKTPEYLSLIHIPSPRDS